jgi:hypothetical protein
MEPQPFSEALEIIAEVMKHGAASHPDNDGFGASPIIMLLATRSISSCYATAIRCWTM